MNSADFQDLSDVRIGEAETLAAQGKWDGAYYLAGYAVECALKACIAKLTNLHDFPPKVSVVQKYYTHDINTLLKSAGLGVSLDDARATDPELGTNWDVVAEWSEESRYARHTQASAEGIYKAITDPNHGVLEWLKQRW